MDVGSVPQGRPRRSLTSCGTKLCLATILSMSSPVADLVATGIHW